MRNAEAPDHWSQIVGMPDKWDKDNITRLIDNFKKRRFSIEGQVISGKTYIEMCVAEAKISHQADAIGNEYNVKSKDSDMRALYTMPPELNTELLEAYPTFSRDQKHVLWFAKNFKEFLIARKV